MRRRGIPPPSLQGWTPSMALLGSACIQLELRANANGVIAWLVSPRGSGLDGGTSLGLEDGPKMEFHTTPPGGWQSGD